MQEHIEAIRQIWRTYTPAGRTAPVMQYARENGLTIETDNGSGKNPNFKLLKRYKSKTDNRYKQALKVLLWRKERTLIFYIFNNEAF